MLLNETCVSNAIAQQEINRKIVYIFIQIISTFSESVEVLVYRQPFCVCTSSMSAGIILIDFYHTQQSCN